ncbi:MAG: RNA polymerase sigma-54 factor, partial [Chloroflexi bacterium]
MDLRLLPQQQLKVTPKQIAANAILQLSSLELQDVINQELQENPALDLEEQQVCPLCGQPLPGRVCLNCFGLAKAPRSNDPETEPLEGTSLMQRDDDGDEFDPVVRAESEQTLAEWLSWNVRVLLPARLLPVAEYLIGNINENGYLDPSVTIEDAANTMKVSVADAMRALRAIQSVEPWGIGARDVRECLMIQMQHLEEVGEEVPPHVREIVSDHFREMGEHKFGDVAQALRITRDEVQSALDYIAANLNPHPASRRFSLRVNPVYRQLIMQLQAARKDGGAATVPMNDDDRQHIREYVTRAKFFIDNINQRRQTILRITEVIVECQLDFLEHGIQSLRPLTRAEVGERIGMHESTVSRATAGKFVLLPTGQVVPFAMFFTASLGTKDVIKQIIEAEDEGRPYSDQEIVEKLAEKHGIKLARRT